MIATGSVIINAMHISERAYSSGMTSTLGKFQELLWEEYASKKQCKAERSISPHVFDPIISGLPEQVVHKGRDSASISNAFTLEEGPSSSVIEDWCREIYQNASNSPAESAAADLTAEDSGVIQCSLLRFLAKRQLVRCNTVSLRHSRALTG